MSLIHYKFKSAKDYNTITFDGLTISLFELKRDILIDSKLKGSDFDIIISNAQSDEDYSDDTQLIPKNTSVYVRRVPAKPGGSNAQLYLSAANSTNGGSKREPETRTESSSANALDPSLDLGLGLPLSLDGVLPGESEEDKLKSLFDQSSMQWGQPPSQTTGYQPGFKNHSGPNRGGNFQGVPLSSTYVCHRCGIKGHYVQNCPSIHDKKLAQPKVKRTTGIPRSFLKNVEAIPEGKGAMITSDGSLVVAQTNDNAWKKFQLTQRGSAVSSDILRETATIPSDLSCNLCDKLLTGAVSVPCCSKNFCLECITEALLEKPTDQQFICPSCGSLDIVPDSLIVENSLRSKVDEHLRLWAIELHGDSQINEAEDLLKDDLMADLELSPPTEQLKVVPIIDSSEDREFNQRPMRNFGGNRAQDIENITLASDTNFGPAELDDSETLEADILPEAPTLRWTYGGGMSEKPLSPEEVARLNKIPFVDCQDVESRGRSRDRQNAPHRDLRHNGSRGDDSRQHARSRHAPIRSSKSPSSDEKRHKHATRQGNHSSRISGNSSRRPASPDYPSREETRLRGRRPASPGCSNRDEKRARGHRPASPVYPGREEPRERDRRPSSPAHPSREETRVRSRRPSSPMVSRREETRNRDRRPSSPLLSSREETRSRGRRPVSPNYSNREEMRSRGHRPASPVYPSRDEARASDRRREKSRSLSRPPRRESSRTRRLLRRSRSPSREHSPDRRHRSERRPRQSPNRHSSPKRQSPRPARRSGGSSHDDRPETMRRRSDTKISPTNEFSPNSLSETRVPVSRRLGKRKKSLDAVEPTRGDILSRVGPANALPLSSRLGDRVQDVVLDTSAKKRRKSRRKDSKGKALPLDPPAKPIRIAHISKRD